MLFITPRSAESRNCHREINYALGKDKQFLAIHLQDTELPSGLALEVGDRQAIYKSKYTAADYQEKLQHALSEMLDGDTLKIECTPDPENHVQAPVSWNKPGLISSLFLTVSIVSLVVAGLWWQSRQSAQQTEVLFRAWENAVNSDNFLQAFTLGQDLKLTESQRNSFSLEGDLLTDPPGAVVEITSYTTEAEDWIDIGKTPIKAQLPLGAVKVRISKQGYQSLIFLLVNPSVTLGNTGVDILPDTITIPLIKEGKYPGDMIYAPPGNFVPSVVGFGVGPPAMLGTGAYLVDKYEVTNKQYQEFVDSKGYERTEFWRELSFREGERTLSFEEAKGRFLDTTGQLGPSTWESGTYPLGEDDFPVSGVSWYEATAYSRFVNKDLPAIAYWAQTAFTAHGGGFGVSPHLGFLVPASNFGKQGANEISTLKGLSPFGTYGQAGNVREWQSNTAGEKYWILGGAASDPSYMSTLYNAEHPLDRSSGNGLRLVRYLEQPSEALLADRPLLGRTPKDYIPVSDEVFATFKEQYQYDHSKLDVIVEKVDESREAWVWETISIRTGYDNTRFKVHLLKPRQKRRAETVVFFNGAGAIAPQPNRFEPDKVMASIDFVINSGRTVIVPEVYESYSRSTKYMSSSTSVEFGEWLVKWHSDLGRTLDYLQSRPEEFGRTFTWYGISYGANQQIPLIVMDDRISSAVLLIGGVTQSKARLSFSDALNYVPRITIPVLFIGARYDNIFPTKYSQQPFLDLLGTPSDQVRYIEFEGSHTMPPRRLLVREVVNWLDLYVEK